MSLDSRPGSLGQDTSTVRWQAAPGVSYKHDPNGGWNPYNPLRPSSTPRTHAFGNGKAGAYFLLVGTGLPLVVIGIASVKSGAGQWIIFACAVALGLWLWSRPLPAWGEKRNFFARLWAAVATTIVAVGLAFSLTSAKFTPGIADSGYAGLIPAFALSLLGPLIAWRFFSGSNDLRQFSRVAWHNLAHRDIDANAPIMRPTLRVGFEERDRVACRRLAVFVAILASAPALVGLNAATAMPHSALLGLPCLLFIGGAGAWLQGVLKSSPRMPRWEGPARYERIFVMGEWKWLRVGDPNGDPARDDPRAAHATGPAKAGYVKTFNHETGEYEWRQRVAARDGDPNCPAPAAPFQPKGEHGDTPDLKPEGGFI